MCSFSCLATYDTTSSSWTTVANDSAYASYSVLSVAPDNRFIAVGNIHGMLKVMLVTSLSPLCESRKFYLFIVIHFVKFCFIYLFIYCRNRTGGTHNVNYDCSVLVCWRVWHSAGLVDKWVYWCLNSTMKHWPDTDIQGGPINGATLIFLNCSVKN